jgi:tetratricopeptide (TPR) repeat protein
LKVITIAVFAAALAATGANAYELCDVPGKQKQFYASNKPLRGLLKDRKFRELDSKMSAMLAAQQAGRMTDAQVHLAFSGLVNDHASWGPLLREWVSQFPKSQSARLALGYHLADKGWAVRGSKFAYETSPEQLALMDDYFRAALSAYDEADARGRKLSVSVAQRMNMAATTSSLGLDVSRLYREGIKRYPETLQVRIEYVYKSAPKWGGSVEQLESIVDDASTLPPADKRYIQYLVYHELGSFYWCAEGEGCGAGKKRNGENAKQVIGYYEKSIAMCPGLDDSLDSLRRYLQERRNYTALIESTSRMIERNPRQATAFASRGFAYAHMHKFREAFADYERAALLGDGYSTKQLAGFYESGTVVPKDARKAIDLYLIAESRNGDGARKEAERLSKTSGVPLK